MMTLHDLIVRLQEQHRTAPDAKVRFEFADAEDEPEDDPRIRDIHFVSGYTDYDERGEPWCTLRFDSRAGCGDAKA
jgi:hypothetical protein